MYDIPCIILSGGKSSRMGKDKSLLPFGGFDTLIEYQYDKLSKIFKYVYISSKIDKFNFKANLILDKKQDTSSPMIALESIFEQLNANEVFIITVDVPFLEKNTIETIINNSNNSEVTVAKDKKNVHYLCGIYKKTLLTSIKLLIIQDIHKISYLLKNSPSYHEISFSNQNQFLNINKEEDYKEAIYISNCY